MKLKNELEDCLTKIKNIESEIARITKDNTNLENKIKILLKDKDSTIHSDIPYRIAPETPRVLINNQQVGAFNDPRYE